MRLNNSLERWVEAGLIDKRLSERIQAYEQARGSWDFTRVMLGLGVFAILLGVTALVAANWAFIPSDAKLGGHFILNASIGIALYIQLSRRRTSIVTELLLGGLSGLTLTFIGLVGQVYQIQAPTWHALVLWLVLITPPILAFATTRPLIELWIGALLFTYADYLINTADMFGPLGLTLFCSLPVWVMIAAGQSRALRNWREKAMTCLSFSGFVIGAIFVSAAQIIWRSDFDIVFLNHAQQEIMLQACLINFACAIGLFVARRLKFLVDMPEIVDLLLIVSPLFAFLPKLIPHGNMPVMGAVMIIFYWALCGWVGVRAGYPQVLRLAAQLIALRLIIVYLEVFGSLASTGVGLIISGVVVIVIIYGARKVMALLPTAKVGKA